MVESKRSQNGFSVLAGLLALLVIVGVGAGGWYVLQKNDKAQPKHQASQQDSSSDDNQDESAQWTKITTQEQRLSMRIPDGWKVTSYPGDYLGSVDVTYTNGSPATTDTLDTEYMGHSLRFRASISALDGAGLGPQWSSPQAGLQEQEKDFAIGDLHGKRYKADFTQDLNQTIYEYVFALSNNKKLDIVYTVDHSQNQTDDITVVEQAIKTISLNQD